MAHSLAFRILVWSIRSTSAMPTPTLAVATIAAKARSRAAASSALESAIPGGMLLGSSTTAAATTGPAHGARPASSMPAIGPPRNRSETTSISNVALGRESLPAMRALSRTRPRLSKKAQLLASRDRRLEQIRPKLQHPLVHAEPFEGESEAQRDLLCIGAGPALAQTKLGFVVLTAMHRAEDVDDPPLAMGILSREPLPEKVLEFKRQAQQHISRLVGASF